MEKTNKNIHRQIPVQLIFNLIDKDQTLTFIQKNLNLIDKNIFPKFKYHNIKHSINVGLISMVISKFYKIDKKDRKILLDAALLHDIGRIDDFYNYEHSYIGSNLVEVVLTNQKFYQNKENLLLLKTLILGHDKNIYDTSIFKTNSLNINDKNILLLKILKDSDILERIRLQVIDINIKELNLEYSKYLFDFVKHINILTNQIIEMRDTNELPKYNR